MLSLVKLLNADYRVSIGLYNLPKVSLFRLSVDRAQFQDGRTCVYNDVGGPGSAERCARFASGRTC